MTKKLEEVLRINGISKSYGRLLALNKLSLTVPKGSVYGILGPNGSGKTTTLGIILGVINPKEGNYVWFGEQPSDHQRKKIGALLETPNFYPYLSGSQNLKIAASIKGVSEKDAERVLELVNLANRKNSKFSTYSLGMKQRLALASVLLGDPDVLVLDEPANGLDPQGIAEVRELIRKLGELGKTILLASHIIEEVEKVCTHVVVLKQGNKITEGEIDEVLKEEDFILIDAPDQEQLFNFLKNFSHTRDLNKEKGKIKVSFNTSVTAFELNKLLFEKGIVLSHLETKKKTLETKFLELTK